MPPPRLSSNANLLSLLGFDATSIQGLLGETFQNTEGLDKFLQPSFNLASEALSELPGQRREQLSRLSSTIGQRGITEGTRIRGTAAGTGFAGSGQISQLETSARTGRERTFETGTTRIGEDIQRQEAGIVGALSGKVSSFLSSLLASGAELAAGPGASEGSISSTAAPDPNDPGPTLSFEDWLGQQGLDLRNLQGQDRFNANQDYQNYLQGRGPG